MIVKYLSSKIFLFGHLGYYSLCIRQYSFNVSYRFNRKLYINSPLYFNQLSKCFSKGKYEFSDDEFYDRDPESQAKNRDYVAPKTCLFPESRDPNLQLILTSDIKGILVLAESLNPLTIEQASQAIVSFYDMKKPSVTGYFKYEESYGIVPEIGTSTMFDKMLLVLSKEYRTLQNNALITTLLALSRLQIPETDNYIIENMIMECCRRLKMLSMKEVSKLTTVMKNVEIQDFYVSPVIDMISSKIETCNEDKLIKYVAVSLNNACRLASVHCIRNFANKVEEFILQGQDMTYKTSLACLMLFGKYEWRREFIDLQQHLLTFLIDFVPMLFASELVPLFWTIIVLDCTVIQIVTALEKRTLELVTQSSRFLEMLVLLNCVRSSTNKLRYKLEISSYLTECSKTADPKDAVHVQLMLSTLLNLNPIKQESLVNKYLLHAFDTLPFTSLFYCCRAYIFNNLNARSIRQNRNQVIIPDLSNLLEKRIQNHMKPSEIAFFLSMGIATSVSTTSVECYKRLLDMLPQLNIFALSMVSLGLNFLFKNFKNIPAEKEESIYNLNDAIFETCRKTLSCCKSLNEFNLSFQMLSIALNYKGKHMSSAFDWELLNAYNRFTDDRDFSPRTIFLASKLLKRHRICLPRFLDIMACNIVERPSCQNGETITMLLACCYAVNYCPRVPGFLSKCQENVISENENLKCYSILNAALSLGFFEALDERLIHLIFNESFLEKLEKEIPVTNRYKSAEMQFSLAILNRLVCIDFPQFNLPWFHEQFYKNVYSESGTRMDLLEEEVFRVLHQVLPSDQCLSIKPFGPYYTEISFECQLDKSNYPIMYSVSDKTTRTVQTLPGFSPNVQRVAVNVLSDQAFCKNLQRMGGPEVLKQRHLEILGYKVIQVPHYEWNSLQLSKTEAKVDYLHAKIFQ